MPAERDEVLDWSEPPDRWRAPEPPPRSGPSTAVNVLLVAAVTIGVLGTIGIIAAIAMPSLIKKSKQQNESAAIGGLRTIISAQTVFREADREGDGVLDYASSLAELERARLIDPVLATGEKHGYRVRIIAADAYTWSALAVPVRPGKDGGRSFFVDESGVIRERPSPGAEATVKDPATGG